MGPPTMIGRYRTSLVSAGINFITNQQQSNPLKGRKKDKKKGAAIGPLTSAEIKRTITKASSNLGRVLTQGPSSLGRSFSKGPSDLSRAIAQRDWGRVTQICKEFPDQAKVWSLREGFFDGRYSAKVLPLHEAIVDGAPPQCIKAVIDAYPKALTKPETSYNRLPLHCACRKHAQPRIVALVAECYRAAVMAGDSLDRLPIHYALSNGADVAVVNILMKINPRSASSVDHRGWTPLFVACNMGAKLEVIKIILDAYPEVVYHKTNRGHTVNNCLRNCPDYDAIEKLLAEKKRQVEKTIRLPSLVRKKPLDTMVLV